MAILGFLIKAAIWLVRFLTRQIPNKSQQASPPQPQISASPPQPSQNSYPVPAHVPQPQAQAVPPIHVTVNLPPEPGWQPRSKMAAILGNIDHSIYVAGIDDMVFPHPRGEELLEMLDRMLFVAAHKDGEPFSLPPKLDTSPIATQALAPLTIDKGFDDVLARALPAEDGQTWMAKAGFGFSLMPPALSRKVRSPIVVMRPEPDPMPDLMPADADFDVGPLRALPTPDGHLWMAALENVFARLPSQ